MTAAGPLPRRILVLAPNLSVPLATIRLRTPLDALAAADGHTLRYRSFAYASPGDLRWAEVVIIQRGAGLAARRQQQIALRQGKPVIYEIDDLLTELPPQMVQHRHLRRDAARIAAMVRDATVVSVSTRPLADALAALNPRRVVVPNHGHQVPGLSPARHDAAARPLATLLVAATDRIALDALAPALQRVMERHAGQIEIVAIAEAASALRAFGLPARTEPLMWRDPFLRLVAGLVNPIGLIPLPPSRFNACKSAVKFFDYALAGVPTVCARVTPYAEVIAPGRNGELVDDDVGAWESAIEGLVEEADRRRDLAGAAAHWVRAHASLGHTVQAWRELLADLPAVAATPPRHPPHLALGMAAVDAALSVRRWLRLVNRWRLARRKRIAEPNSDGHSGGGYPGSTAG
jgi:hypothetical protein